MSQITEDLVFLRHPSRLLDGIKSLRQKAKFYNQMEEVFIRQVYRWLYDKIKPDTTVIDIGSFIGDTAIYFALNPNVKKVLAYEPNPTSYLICRENLQKCPIKTIELSNHAVSNREGSMLITHNYPTGYSKAIHSDKETQIRTIPINMILKSYKGQNVAIKCDAEGAEYEIFEKDTDLGSVYLIMAEYHGGPERLEAVLKQKGYTISTRGEGKIGYLMAFR